MANKSALRIEPILQISVATLIVLSTLLLGLGQQQIVLYTSIALAAAVTSVVFVDLRKTLLLSQSFSRFLAYASCVWLVIQMVRNVEQSQLLNVANILVFLEAILLLQPKEINIYWQLFALSLLQVAVASALNLGFVFGVILVLYIGAGILAMALFCAFREIRSTEVNAEESKSGSPFSWYSPRDVSDFVISKSFLGRLGWMALFTFLGTIMVFFAVPRYNSQAWEQGQAQGMSTVGFTEEVELDDIGSILENPEEVMRVDFKRLDGSHYVPNEEIYFRGTVLAHYEGRGSWKKGTLGPGPVDFRSIQPRDLSAVIEQNTTLRPSLHNVLFSVVPSYSPTEGQQNRIVFNRHSRQIDLQQQKRSDSAPIRYQTLTTGIKDGVQTDWIPVFQDDLIVADGSRIDWKLGQLLKPWGADGAADRQGALTAIKRFADQIISEAGLDEGSSIQKANELRNHFLHSGQYRYSLEIRPKRRSVDPIVDFLENVKTGHCEFYASALALMLRSQGIPARLIIGYKGGDFNGLGSYYTIRQLHCHAWVEAYIPPAEIPEGALTPREDTGQGAWLRLDATPMDDQMVGQKERWVVIQTIDEFFEYCQVLWDEYVLGLNSDTQQASIYQPIKHAVQMSAYFLFGKDLWLARWNWLKQQAHSIITGRWLTRQTIVLLVILTPLLYAVRRQAANLIRRFARQLLRRIRPRKGTLPGEIVYFNLERILAKFGIRRGKSQTQMEFVAQAIEQLRGNGMENLSPQECSQIVDAFYSDRFGTRPINADETQQLEQALANVQNALK